MKKQAEASANDALVVLVNEGQLSAYGKGSRFGLIHDTFVSLPPLQAWYDFSMTGEWYMLLS